MLLVVLFYSTFFISMRLCHFLSGSDGLPFWIWLALAFNLVQTPPTAGLFLFSKPFSQTPGLFGTVGVALAPLESYSKGRD